jgi:hypothetical protein
MQLATGARGTIDYDRRGSLQSGAAGDWPAVWHQAGFHLASLGLGLCLVATVIAATAAAERKSHGSDTSPAAASRVQRSPSDGPGSRFEIATP